MKTRVVLPFAGLMLLTLLFVGGALCGSCSAYTDWSLSQAGHQPEGAALSASFGVGRISRR
jgi:hypothetical protein